MPLAGGFAVGDAVVVAGKERAAVSGPPSHAGKRAIAVQIRYASGRAEDVRVSELARVGGGGGGANGAPPAAARSPPAAVRAAAPAPSSGGKLSEGDLVEAQYRPGQWFPGTISKVNGSYYEVKWADGSDTFTPDMFLKDLRRRGGAAHQDPAVRSSAPQVARSSAGVPKVAQQPKMVSSRLRRKDKKDKHSKRGLNRGSPRKKRDRKHASAKWSFDEKIGCYIALTTTNTVDPVVVETKDEAVAMLQESPDKYYACEWLQEGFKGTVKVFPRECQFYKEGWAQGQEDANACMIATYQALPGDVDIEPDQYTDSILCDFQGQSHTGSRCPGRGQGVADGPGLKVIGDVDPNDIKQGQVGDCWLLSAISALAEFDGAVRTLFRNSGDIADMPADKTNNYTVTLYDLKTWEPVDVQVDERLVWHEGADALLGCKPSDDNELWVCYLEKAVAAHCGGWDKIDGGFCTHAWRMLTGCKDVYTITEQDGQWGAQGIFNPNTQTWDECDNPPSSIQGLWPMAWPEVGGGGDYNLKIDTNALFERMCAWDDENYIMGAGTRAGSDSQDHEGIVDGHAYTVMTCIDNAGGTEFDMILVRNPWGSGEFHSGDWVEGGDNWKKYPEVYEACGRPVEADDGMFWIEKSDFFKYFKTIYLCAHNMTELKKH